MKFKKKTILFIELLFLSLLVIYPLRHVCQGVDLMDGGYNYANFTYSGLEFMDSMWYFATWSANIFGSFLTKLPWGNTMLGMNLYTTLPVCMMAVVCYLFCTRKLKLSKVLTFVGEMAALSLCWLPTGVLYTYLTYVLFLAGTLFLYQGLTKEKRSCLILAGICLGCNVGVRFSNLPQMGLILAVWYYALLKKKKPIQVLQETGFCILGYVGALGVFFGIIAIGFGIEEYAEGIQRLFAMTEYATDYATDSMLWGMVGGYFKISYWLKRCILAGGCAFLACLLLPKKWLRVKQVITIGCMLVLLWWFKDSGFFTLDYASYYSVYYPCVLVLLMAMGLSLFQMVDKDLSKEEKLQGILVLLLILLTSLGSNNAIFSTMNNLFLIMPCFLGMLYNFVKHKKHILFFPFQTILMVGTLLLLIQSAGFGWRYVYEEADGARDLSVKITQIPVLRGIYTGAPKAAQLEGLYAFLQENDLQDKECILYGDIPGISYYMELAPAMNIWSDLRSYSPQTMLQDMKKIEADINDTQEYPLIILHQKYMDYYENGKIEKLPQEITVKQKLDYLCEFAAQHKYSILYRSDRFAVLGK